ncbi:MULTISPECIES: O-antigen ligase [unclassified Duganella]|uniref:O-antigen ligase family protein n=1 Tax=unclassified Duganella TaxID=2636909 RepID=UPI00088AE351|nr:MULTISPECIES: O-antigen ligase family protein [unclassified Duganella]SDF93729.1 O-antigen ligase [Duganella sp. OV458]SDJ11065.1 O-antigen ligase [Duganella sp. OV510]
MNNTTQSRASTVLIHSLIFLFPFLLLITNFGVGLCSFAFLVTAFVYRRRGWPELVRHLTDIRGVLIAFSAVLLLAVLLGLMNGDGRMRDLEKPLRMLAASSVMLTVLACRPSRKALWWGLIAGAVAGCLFIAYQRWGMGVDRPGGLINSITFGDIMLCLGLMCLAATLDFAGRSAAWPALGALAGLTGSIATGTRGGWLAIGFSVLLLVRFGHVLHGRWRKALALLALALVVSTYFIPQTGARERIDEGISDVQHYFNGGPSYTSVGIRLELWRSALQLIEKHPLAGASVPTVRAELEQLVAEGRAHPYVLDFDHFHNDLLQVLVYGGVVGLLAWGSTLVAPFLFFRRQLQCGDHLNAPALAGMLLVLSYFSFGLTEVIFWSMRSNLFYAMMLFLLAGLCLNAKENQQ